MKRYPLVPLDARFWRMLSIRWQREPLASGSDVTGGRWNAIGNKTLYFGADHATAISEYHRSLARPGTLAAYDVRSDAIADLADGRTLEEAGIDSSILSCDWQTIHALEGRTPPSWTLAEQLVAQGAEGALAPSAQNAGGVNLVLWRWGKSGGARVRVFDPEGDLG